MLYQLFIFSMLIAAAFSYTCQTCYGNMCCNIPANHQYYLTSFCEGSGTTACGYSCSSLRYFTADRQRFGCHNYLNLCARGKCLKAKVTDAGPANWVEQRAGMPIIDASVPTCQYFTGRSGCGWSDRVLITAVPTTVNSDDELGPFNVTEEEYNQLVSEGQRWADAWAKKQEQENPKVAPCCSPKQWEGYQFTFDESHHFTAGLNISYDYQHHRFRVVLADRKDPRHPKVLETIALFHNRTVYTINHQTHQCISHHMMDHMEQDCVPRDARLSSSPVIGGSLKTNVYHYTRVEHFDSIDHIEVRTADKCLLVDSFVSDPKFGIDVNYFWDMTEGIKNPGVFNPPAHCRPGVLADIDHPMMERMENAVRAITYGNFRNL